MSQQPRNGNQIFTHHENILKPQSTKFNDTLARHTAYLNKYSQSLDEFKIELESHNKLLNEHEQRINALEDLQ